MTPQNNSACIIMNNNKFIFKIIAVLALTQLALNQCEKSKCQTCRQKYPGDYACLACKPGYQLVTRYNICMEQTSVVNCALYDQTVNCLQCRPSYKQYINLCSKMFDGCFLYQLGGCSVCWQGAFLSRGSKNCSISHLNCKLISDTGNCTQCYTGYSLSNGRCIDTSMECAGLNHDTGLCSQCQTDSILIGYTCVKKNSKGVANCYAAKRGNVNVTCMYCKLGYCAYFGECLSVRNITNDITFNVSQCNNAQYLRDNQVLCFNGNGKILTNCLQVDFGFNHCLLCQNMYILNDQNQCIPILTNLCKTMNTNGQCLQCKDTYYLSQGQCIPFPPFCLNYSKGCTQCAPSFKLVNGVCIDPNCQTINPITSYCQICSINYQINPSGVCKYVDQNCKTTNLVGDCLQCLRGYYLKNNGMCGYRDINCLTFNATGFCTLCKPFYYVNPRGQICIPLPKNCFKADGAGRCVACQSQFTLTSSYQCLFINSLPNCNMVDAFNHTLCKACISGFFAGLDGICHKLPPFCNQIDPSTGRCTQCSPNGLMQSGNCVDKNCQIFDSEGSCLACLKTYQFGQLGQCTPQKRDSNCKKYIHGVCKSCAQRYFFDFQFNCIPVSPFCKTYDQNSGQCTTCYSGYQFTSNGDCTVIPFNSLYLPFDILVDSCKQTNEQGQCVQCNSGYNQVMLTTIPVNGTRPVVNCVQKIMGNSYCLQMDKTGKCIKCISRMYVDSTGKCKGIDENCDKYNKTSGLCINCYPGYVLNSDNQTCSIKVSKDPKCQINGNSSVDGCLKCYQGYFYSKLKQICTMVDPQCKTYNTTTGHCLSCYPGYQLSAGKCGIGQSTATITDTNPKSNSSGNPQGGIVPNSTAKANPQSKPVGCLTYNFEANTCIGCEWGYAMINQTCQKRDPNCQSFQNKNSLICTQCYKGYTVFIEDKTRCIQDSLLVQNCKKYSQQVECIQCQIGFVVSKNTLAVVPSSICKAIDPNCQQFNQKNNICDKCNEGAVLEGRICVFPTFGVDPNCLMYKNKLCEVCKQGWKKEGHICAQQ